MQQEKRTIIFFDGICHLCNSFVDFMVHRKSDSQLLYFAPLQGATAAEMLTAGDRTQLDSVIIFHQGRILKKSEAVITALGLLPGWTKGLKILRYIPAPVRDYLYEVVAASRYTLWGKRETCRIPTPAERAYLLP